MDCGGGPELRGDEEKESLGSGEGRCAGGMKRRDIEVIRLSWKCRESNNRNWFEN
jgi:hypothetical protein